MSSDRQQMALDCTSPNQINMGFDTKGNLLTMNDGRFRRWLKEALQNPLTFVCLVWATMFLMTVLFLKLID